MASTTVIALVFENVECILTGRTIKVVNGRRFKVQADGSTVTISNAEEGSGNSYSFCGGSSHISSVVGGMVVSQGLAISQARDGGVDINGVRYSPYTLKRGPRAGKKVLLFDGWQSEFVAAADAGAPSASAAPAPEVGFLEYTFEEGTQMNVQKISARAAARVVISASSIFGSAKTLGLSASGASNIDVQSPKPELSSLKISCFGASNVAITCCKTENVDVDVSGASNVFGGGSTAEWLNVDASGSSNIRGFIGNKDVTAEASGMSRIEISALKAASVNKDVNGMATVTVSRV